MITLGAWVHDLGPIAFQVGPVAIRWYGLSYVLGFVAGWWLLTRLARRGLILIPPDRVADAAMLWVAGVVVGGRLGYAIVYDPSLFVTFQPSFPFWALLQINKGGMASHGGIVGTIIAAAVIARGFKNADGVRVGKSPGPHMMDTIAVVCPIGLGLGRLANFINGELLGKIVTMPGAGVGPWWAVKFPQEVLDEHAPVLTAQQRLDLSVLAAKNAMPGDEYFDQQYHRVLEAIWRGGERGAQVKQELAPLLAARHPSQLYQFLAEGVVLGAVLWWIWRKPRNPGVVGSWFLITYGALRVLTEFWRLPDGHLAVQRMMGLSRGQWLSVLMVTLGLAFLAHYGRKKNVQKIGGWMRRDTPIKEPTA